MQAIKSFTFSKMSATIDFVSEVTYLIHMTEKSYVTTIEQFRERGEAENARERLGGRYGYIIGSFAEMESSRIPAFVLLAAHRKWHAVDRFSIRKTIERKVWKFMSDQTEEVQKAEVEGKKAEAKRLAEVKKQEAAAKKEATAKVVADKKAAAQLKKDEAAKAAQAKKDAAQAKKSAVKTPAVSTSRIDPKETITLLVETNPKREGSEAHKRFALYSTGMTVQAFLDAGGSMADVNWDLGHRLISLTAPVSQPAVAEATS